MVNQYCTESTAIHEEDAWLQGGSRECGSGNGGEPPSTSWRRPPDGPEQSEQLVDDLWKNGGIATRSSPSRASHGNGKKMTPIKMEKEMTPKTTGSSTRPRRWPNGPSDRKKTRTEDRARYESHEPISRGTATRRVAHDATTRDREVTSHQVQCTISSAGAKSCEHSGRQMIRGSIGREKENKLMDEEKIFEHNQEPEDDLDKQHLEPDDDLEKQPRDVKDVHGEN